MRRSSGFSQLLKGIVIGVILILAIFGSMSLLEKKQSGNTSEQTSPSREISTIEAPAITINPKTPVYNNANNDTKIATEAEENTDTEQQGKPETDNQDQALKTPLDTGSKPILEGEKTAEKIEAEQQAKAVKYGMLKISAVNPANSENIKADFVVFDVTDKKIAATANTKEASHRLPIGKYKIVSTLNKVDEISGKTTPLTQKTQYVSVLTDSITNQIFKFEPPPTIGILQVSAVSAKNNKQPIKANFIVQKEDGDTVATRNNVTNSLFKLNAGSYKVTVKSGNNSDFRTIVVEPGESAKEVFLLQEAFKQGRVLVRVFDTRSSTAINAKVVISASNGEVIKEFKSTSKAEISLLEGDYKIQVSGPNGQSNKNIRVVAGQANNEIFRFDAPQESPTSQDIPPAETVVTNNTMDNTTGNVTIRAVDESANTTEVTDTKVTENKPDEPVNNLPVQGTLSLYAQNATDNKPLKSNFYIQSLAGKHLDKKIYADSAVFKLNPGTYKVTVRSKNRAIQIKTITVLANQNTNNSFLLIRNDSVAAKPTTSIPAFVPAPPKPVKTAPVRAAIPNGFLRVAMLAARNQRITKNSLNTHFIVSTDKGKKVVELTSVPSGNFKLDAGMYIVTAIHNNKRRNQKVRVRQGKTATINFNSGDFQSKIVRKGSLRSRVVNTKGQPLRANLTVTTMQGQVVARANGVSVGVFDLPPAPYKINVEYQGLRGTESIRIIAAETTVQTFTIAADNSAPANRQTPQKPQNRKDILRDKIKEELRRIF